MRFFMLLLLFLSFVGCALSRPPIIFGLGSGDGSKRDERFTQRLKEKFPVGSKTGEMIAELESQGFKLPADYEYGDYKIGGIVCNKTWRVIYDRNEELIANIRGMHILTCW